MTPQEAIAQLSDARLEELANQFYDLDEQEFEKWLADQEDSELLGAALVSLMVNPGSQRNQG